MSPNLADETAGAGVENHTPLAEGIDLSPEETYYTGWIRMITIDVKEEK